MFVPRRDRASDEAFLTLGDALDADRLLQLEDSPALIEPTMLGCAALLAVFDVVEVVVFLRVDEARPCRRPGTSGTRFVKSSRRATSRPGVPGPPISLCGETKIASR